MDELWFAKRHDRPRSANMRVETALGEATRVVVRGEAGSGKTTLLDWLAVTAARSGFTGKLAGWNGRVPFPIRLRSFAAEPLPRPEEFLAHISPALAPPDGWARRILESGRGMVLVDGVDEVGAGHRREVKAWLRGLSQAFEKTLFVVTSRTAAADQRWLAQEGFGCLLLEPMSADDIEALVTRWHKAADAGGSVRQGTDLSAAQQRLLNQLDSRPHLRMLAASPLLCAMLCALNLAHRSELPRDRMDLYRKALSMLLHLRDAERKIDVILTEAQKQVLLGDLAWRLSLASKVELPKDRVREHIARRLPSLPHVDHTPDEVLDHLLERSGVLREPVRDRVDFVHRTFQECLAANEATEQDHLETLIERAHLDTWWETIVMACGYAKHHQAGTLLTGILDRAEEEPRHARHLRLLAAACLETVSNAAPAVITRVEAVIREQLVPPRSIRETQSLASIGHRVLRYLPPTLAGLSDAAAAATVRAAALTAGDDALQLLRSYAQDSRPLVQYQLTEAWQYFEPERFAAEVLSESPLDGGEASVQSSRLLPHVGHLKNLTKLTVELSSADEQSDLEFLGDVPHLRHLSLHFPDDQAVDVSPLASHRELAEVSLYFALRYKNLRKLQAVPSLRSATIFRSSPWRSLDALGGLTQLEELYLDQLHRLDGLGVLADLSNLTRLRLWECTQRTLGSDTVLVKPTDVALYGAFGDPKRVLPGGMIAAAFPNAEHLNLQHIDLEDPHELAKLPLETLSVTGPTELDLRPFSGLRTFRRLTLMGAGHPVDLSPLAGDNVTIAVWKTPLTGTEELGPGVKLIVH